MPEGDLGFFFRLEMECPHCGKTRDASVGSIISDEGVKCYNRCPYHKSNPHVLMVQPTKDRPHFDAPSALNDPSNRRILA
jgi:hypothetical protein